MYSQFANLLFEQSEAQILNFPNVVDTYEGSSVGYVFVLEYKD